MEVQEEFTAAEDATVLGAIAAGYSVEGLTQLLVLPNRTAADVRARYKALLYDQRASDAAVRAVLQRLPELSQSAQPVCQPYTDGTHTVDESVAEAAAHEPRACASITRKACRQGAVCIVAGPRSRWCLKKQLCVLGRRPSDGAPVDVDLSLEGDASRVSRQHAVLEHRPDGLLHVRNHGRKPMLIDGHEVQRNERARITAVSLIELGGIPLLVFPTTESTNPPAA